MKWLLRIFFTLILIPGVSILGYYTVDYLLSAPPQKEAVQLEIPEKTSVQGIGRLLQENGLIRESRLFVPYVWLKGETKNFRPGVYELQPGEGIHQIVSTLTDRRHAITIPEGFTVEKVANRMEAKGIDREGFLKAVDHADYDYSFVKEIPNNKGRTHRLEGYLFPSTYSFSEGTHPEITVDVMLRQFEKRLLAEGVKEKLQERGLTVDEWVTIASMVQQEGQVEEELPRIAGVIYNRLDKGMKLQLDATVQYALPETKERLYYKDLKVDSPYNTYLYEGLPPGPIANPGDPALQAALEPEEHNYLFYVTRKDGTGLHYFAETEEEHNKNVEKSKIEQQKREQQKQEKEEEKNSE